MKKSESIKTLEELGLNTLDYYITSDKQEALHYLAKHAYDKLSMRTEKGSEYQCPFYYMKTGEELIEYASKHLKEGYKLLFSPSLDVKGCIAFGTVMMHSSSDHIMEVVFGEGKVRELDSHPNLKNIVIPMGRLVAVDNKQFPGKAHILNQIYRQAWEVQQELDLQDFILEWSYYAHPVGVKKKNEIYWELREA